jgi:hypothetical protein
VEEAAASPERRNGGRKATFFRFGDYELPCTDIWVSFATPTDADALVRHERKIEGPSIQFTPAGADKAYTRTPGTVSMNSPQAAALGRARLIAGLHLVVTVLLMSVVSQRMLDAPASFTTGTMLLGPLAYFGAVAGVLFCFPRELPRWAMRVVPLSVHDEFRDLFGIRAARR